MRRNQDRPKELRGIARAQPGLRATSMSRGPDSFAAQQKHNAIQEAILALVRIAAGAWREDKD